MIVIKKTYKEFYQKSNSRIKALTFTIIAAPALVLLEKVRQQTIKEAEKIKWEEKKKLEARKEFEKSKTNLNP